jgi:hypothetical protein
VGTLVTGLISDLNTLSFIAEHQENLNSIHVIVSGSGLASAELFIDTDATTDGGGVSEATITSSKNNVSLRISLPSAVHPSQSRALATVDGHLETRLSALPTHPISSTSLNTVLTPALSAPNLRALAPSALCCTACDREVADVSRVSKRGQYEGGGGFKDLPSEHWAEMMEIWMCHTDPGFTAEITRKTKDGFWPVGGTVLVGGSYLLVDASEVKHVNMRVESVSSTVSSPIISYILSPRFRVFPTLSCCR